jgi:hypothetical protein
MRTSGFVPVPMLLVMAVVISACSGDSPVTAPPDTRLNTPTPAANLSGEQSKLIGPLDASGFVTIEFPGSTGTFPLDINFGGAVVGRYGLGGVTHGFLRSAEGDFSTIDYPGSNFTVAGGINRTGDIVGWYTMAAAPTVRHGFLLRNGIFSTFDPPGSVFTNPLGIDEDGEIVGRYCTAAPCTRAGTGHFHGFLLKGGVFETVDYPGSRETNLWKITRNDLIAGGYGTPDATDHLFVRFHGMFESIELPGSPPITQDNGGINQLGDIVGTSCDAAPCTLAPAGTHGFLKIANRVFTVDIPGAAATSAIAINLHRYITGAYYDFAGKNVGYVLRASPGSVDN